MNKLTKKAVEQIRDKNYEERFLNEPAHVIFLVLALREKIGYKLVT
jgi:hypothetical protein